MKYGLHAIFRHHYHNLCMVLTTSSEESFQPCPCNNQIPIIGMKLRTAKYFFFLLPGASHRSYPKDIADPFNVSMFCCHHEEPFPAEGPTSSPFHHCRHHCSENVTKYGETFCRRVILCNNNRNIVIGEAATKTEMACQL